MARPRCPDARWLASHSRECRNGDWLGGPARTLQGMDVVRLQREPLSVDEALRFVAGPSVGGTCVFVGTVRDHTDGREGVERLEYEAYEEMAEPAMRKVAEQVRARVPDLARLALLHRHGDLAIGEAAVVVAASAPHRDAAFAAARLAIDTLKATVPIWKKEHWRDGSSEWVACHSGDAPGRPALPVA